VQSLSQSVLLLVGLRENSMEQALIGAGLGAVGSAVTGRDPIKGALLGGAGGGLFGGAGNLMNTGSFMGASPVGAQIAQNAMAANAPFAGAVFNPATGTYLAKDAFLGASTPYPVFTGGQGVFSNAMDTVTNAVPDVLTKNLTPSNLLGVGNLLANIDQRPQMGASPISLSARPGQAPQQYAYNTGGLIRRA
jgi:hypothetical protein